MMTATLLHAAALLCVLSGAACLYAGTPRQSLFPRARNSFPRDLTAASSLIGAAVFFIVGGALLRRFMATETAVFAVIAIAMATLIALPSIAALLEEEKR